MLSYGQSCGALVALWATAASALHGITAPSSIAAGTDFQITFLDANSDKFRVFVAASPSGDSGPACYLENSTTLTSPYTLNIPADVGPDADYYNIAISDLTTGQGATYSNRFNLTNATGVYTEYEDHLDGAEFWDANDLPCTAYACARVCAEASYPDDLTETTAYDTMKTCILACPGVSAAANQTEPAHASTTSSGGGERTTATEAVVTLASGRVVTAVETWTTKGSSTIEEAVLGSATLTVGGAAATIDGAVVSLASSGIVVGSTSTAVFSSVTETAAAATTATGTAATATSTATSTASSAAAAVSGKSGIARGAAVAVFVAGLAVFS